MFKKQEFNNCVNDILLYYLTSDNNISVIKTGKKWEPGKYYSLNDLVDHYVLQFEKVYDEVISKTDKFNNFLSEAKLEIPCCHTGTYKNSFYIFNRFIGQLDLLMAYRDDFIDNRICQCLITIYLKQILVNYLSSDIMNIVIKMCLKKLIYIIM